MIDSGLTPEPGSTLRIYNYADYLSPAGAQGLREEVRRRHPALDVQRRRRGADQDRLEERSSSTCTSRATTRWAGWSRPTCSGRSTTTTCPTPSNLWPQFRDPWYDRGCALHRPVHDLQHRHRLAHRPGPERHRGRPRQPLRLPVGHRSTPATWRSSTTGTPPWRWCCCATGSCDINSDRPRRTSRMVREQLLDLRRRHEAPGHDLHVHRAAGRPVRPVPDVVRRRDQRGLLPAREDLHRRSCATGSPRTARARSTTTWWWCLARGKNPVAAHFFINDAARHHGRRARTSASPATSPR